MHAYCVSRGIKRPDIYCLPCGHWNRRLLENGAKFTDWMWQNLNSVSFLMIDWWFVCLGFSSHSRIFHSYGDVTITVEGLKVLTYARHSWPLSSEGSSACHTYCDTGHPFIMVISEDPWHSHLLPSVWQWRFRYLFLQLRSVAAGIRTPSPPFARRRCNPLRHRRGWDLTYKWFLRTAFFLLSHGNPPQIPKVFSNCLSYI